MNLKHAVVFATALSLAPLTAFAGKKAAAPAANKCCATPTLTQVFDASGINFSGVVDMSYDYSVNDAPLAGRAFDVEKSSFVFHQLNLTMSKQWSNGISLVVNPVFGEDAVILNGVTARRAGAVADYIAFNQAFLQYSIGGFTLQGGKLLTLAGSEVINPAGNINASRGFLFAVMQPLTHTGVRASFSPLRELTFTGGVHNSGAANNAFTNNNPDMSYEFQAAWNSGMFSHAATMYTGDEETAGPVPGSSGANQTNTLYDLVFSVTPVDMLTLGLNADFARIEQPSVGGVTNTETQNDFGIAGYINIKLTPRARLAVRGEYLSLDRNRAPQVAGSPTDYDYINSLTHTFGYTPLSGLELLAEVRFDGGSESQTGASARRVAYTSSGFNAPAVAGSSYQNSATLKAIYKF